MEKILYRITEMFWGLIPVRQATKGANNFWGSHAGEWGKKIRE